MVSADLPASLWLAWAPYKEAQERPHEPREPPRARNRDWVRRNGIAATRDPRPPPRRRSVGGLRNSAQAEHDRRRVVVHAHGTGCARRAGGGDAAGSHAGPGGGAAVGRELHAPDPGSE